MPEQFELHHHPPVSTSAAAPLVEPEAQAEAETEQDEDTFSTRHDMPSHPRAEEPPSSLPHQHQLNRRTVRKLDTVLLPFLALLFLFNSLDKSNIGNAETAHFTADVGLRRRDLNVAVALFFAFFVALQPVGAALGRKYGMARWVPACMSAWGLCTALHVWVTAAWQLYALRIVIATLEAGFYPVTVSYLSLFYTRYEFGRRLAIFYGQAAVAGALGGVLSYAVFSRFPIDEDESTATSSGNGWHSWQILFLIEGSATIMVAITGFFWLPHGPKTAWFLNPEEREWAEERIRLDRDGDMLTHHTKLHTEPTDDDDDDDDEPDHHHVHPSHAEEARRLLSTPSPTILAPAPQPVSDTGLTTHDVLSALFSWKVHYLLLCNILSAIPTTAFSIFLPLVLSPLSRTPALANLLTAPPYLCGAATLYGFTAWSDTRRDRTAPILAGLAVVLAGFAGVLLVPAGHGPTLAARYAALCVLLAGTFVASPLTVAWLADNVPQPGKRAMALGINGWGNVAGVVAAVIFKPRGAHPGDDDDDGETPERRYRAAFVWTACCVLVAFAGYAGFRALLVRENARRRRVLERWDDDEVEAERVAGRGPVGGTGAGIGIGTALGRGRGRGRVSTVDAVLERLGEVRGVRGLVEGVEGWRGADREGDERITFVYGL